MSYLGMGVSPSIVPVYHNAANSKDFDRRIRITELILRWVICGLGIVSAILVGTDSEVQEIFTVRKRAKFTDMKTLVFLVIANGIVAAYSFMQGLRCLVSLLRPDLIFSKPLSWATFSCDQVMAYVTAAAVAAAAQSAVIAKVGQRELEWMKICGMYEKFCNQIGEGIASGFIVSLSMVLTSSISAFTLFRLYGPPPNRPKTSFRWQP